jgi:uncharacterized membrane protein YedE/YeeE
MMGAPYFGYALIAVSAVLLAFHWQHWRDWAHSRERRRREAIRLQLQRRIVASALIGVVGAAMTLIDRVPRNAVAMSAYLFALVLGGAVILSIALADLRATRRRHDAEQIELLAEELRKTQPDAGAAAAEGAN